MPMTDEQINAAKAALAKVQPQQPRYFVIAGKSSETTLYISVASTGSATMNMVEQPYKSGFSWRVMGQVHKQQGKYIFAELDSAGSVREAALVRAINTQLKQGGSYWGGSSTKISTLPALWMPKAQAEALAEHIEEVEGPSLPPDTSTSTAPVIVEDADPFDAYAEAFSLLQAGIFGSSEDLDDAVTKLIGKLSSSEDPFLVSVAEKNLPEYTQSTRKDLLNAVMMVGVAPPKGRVEALAAAKKQVGLQQAFLERRKAEVEAMEKHQPTSGSPVSFTAYKDALTKMAVFCDLIKNTASTEKWFQGTTGSSGTSGTTGTT